MTKITKAAAYLPEKEITNHDLAKYLETSHEWIYSRTGIEKRHLATETTTQLAIEVAYKLMAQENPQELDFIIVASFTPDQSMPNIASQVQRAIGATKAFAFDLNAACSGFVYSLSVANAFLQTGKKQGLIIGAEKISQVIDPFDRTTAVLFGDGAGGVLIKKSDHDFFYETLGSDGSKGDLLTAGFVHNQVPLKMDGRGIFSFVLREVKENILTTIAKSPYTLEEVDYFILHQANERLLQQLAHKLKVPKEKFLSNVSKTGNTSAASIPILLADSLDEKILQLGSNKKVLFAGFGGGLSYGSILMNI